ncbi:hypothetical protein QBC38DRAFT_463761 [Podospora fimiseda]|uniref:Uncharacterized protein n=1 Tax=Podospora fimiseda TaxID=252190 RepID=A0AAN7BZ91_9PEZI|nr:hypothetical protein QBC38DRAFT_463761 [Podospora fimiseda]
MMHGYKIRKGLVFHDYLDSDDETWNSVDTSSSSEWMYDRRPDRTIELDHDGLNIKKDTIPDPDEEVHYRLNFYDPASRVDNPPDDCFQSCLGIPGATNGNPNESQLNLPVDPIARTASLIYVVGQIRLGEDRCDRCKRHTITREGFLHPLMTHIDNPIPFCTTAAPYFLGICGPCFVKGGTEEDMLRRCSLAIAPQRSTNISNNNNNKANKQPRSKVSDQDDQPPARVSDRPVLVGVGSESERAAVREALFPNLP